MASMAVQYLLAELLVVAHQSCCTITSKNFHQLYFDSSPSPYQRYAALSTPAPLALTASCSGESRPLPVRRKQITLTEDDIQQQRQKYVHVIVNMDAVEDK